MTIMLNGHPYELPDGSTLADLIASRKASGHLKAPQFAVERNKEVVPKSTLAAVALQPKDEINVVVFVGGG